MLRGFTLEGDTQGAQLFTKDSQRFAKIFLINPSMNANDWQVEPSSIEPNIKSFIGKEFISEPDLAHFNAVEENLSDEEILKRQRDYAVGDIVDVVYGPHDSYAIVQFYSKGYSPKNGNIKQKLENANQVWQEMLNGKAAYSSPGITGFAHREGKKLVFHQWEGLHLARVDNPAYGIYHASLKATCEGEEGVCKEKLAAAQKISSQLLEDQSLKVMDTKPDDLQKTMSEQIKSALSQIEEIKKQFTTVNTSTDTQPAVTVPAATSAPAPAPATSTTSADSKTVTVSVEEFEKLKTGFAALEAERKQKIIEELIEIQTAASILAPANVDGKRKEYAALTMDQLDQERQSAEKWLVPILQTARKNGFSFGDYSTGNKIVKMPATASEKSVTSLDDLGDWHRRLN